MQTVAADPVHTTYLWHLHQPIYWNDQRAAAPDHYETAWDTIQAQDGGRAHPSDSLRTIFGVEDRIAAYQYRPKDAINTVLGQPDAGAQVNYSGALMENVNSLSGNMTGYFNGWQSNFIQARQWQTSGGKPRMDTVNFTYHHSLAPLHTAKTVEMEIRLHQRMIALNFGTNPGISKGYFPTEMGFSERLIPILKSLGIEWSVVSGNHLSRACTGFPLVLGSGGENTEPPNKADVQNPAQTNYFRQQISRGCAPANAYPFAYTPHRAQYVNPETGVVDSLVVVPAAQEFSWVDGYQCFGAGEIATVAGGNNATRPELILLAHDGDNAFGGGYTYYMECVQNFVNGAASSGYKPSTIQQYLTNYPVPADDVVHVEDGPWVNADGDFGSPTFINWLYPLLDSGGQPDPVNGWHEKAREYAMFIAAENRVRTAEQVAGTAPNIDKILNPDAAATAVERAWHYYLGALDSGNVYYGTPGDMEVRSTVGINQAVARADQVLQGAYTDLTNPSVFVPQRWPYNPGAVNFGVSTGYQQKTLGPDFTVWTFVYDVGGIQSATLYWRTDLDGVNPIASTQNETYAGGSEVNAWQALPMNGRTYAKGNIYNKSELNYYVLPTYIADHYSATITGQTSKLIDYYVEAIDTHGNVTKSAIQHVWVGDQQGSGGGGGTRVTLTPGTPVAGSSVLIQYDPTGGPLEGAVAIKLHWGTNSWTSVASPDVAMTWNAASSRWEATVTPSSTAAQLDIVFNNGSGTWDNNNGGDWHFTLQGAAPPAWTIDGTAESNSLIVAQNGAGLTLWASLQGTTLYVATQGAANARDHFIYLAKSTTVMQAVNWAKAGQVVKWDAYLANESTNNFNGWFDAANAQTLGGYAQQASGGGAGVLEGRIDLNQLYAGAIPTTLYIAAAEFGTNDAGALVSATQCPVTQNGDGNLDGNEFFALNINTPVELSWWTLE
jgi:hypothetical protein